MSKNVILLQMPGLRPQDIGTDTPTLSAWANTGAMASLTPTFPCVTSCVQASMWTGLKPGDHGVIANGFFDRDKREVAFWVARNNVVQGEQIWDILAGQDPQVSAAVWHAQNIKDAAADIIVTPAPIHEPDGSTKLWCYSKPEGLYQELINELGHFPLQHYWGPMAGIQSSQWILSAARWLIQKQQPNFHCIYIPHLDYAAQKFGPNSTQATEALQAIDHELALFGEFIKSECNEAIVVVASEYALTEVTGAVFPNRLLREAGLLAVKDVEGAELIDMEDSDAFAMVDHQFAQVYCENDGATKRAVDALSGIGGLDGVYAGDDRKALGMEHDRCGEIVLVAQPDHWFAYYWWLDDAKAPPFARTVDIHQKPGYDPCELFFDPATKSIPLDASLVKGSHGAPAVNTDQQAVLICSQPNAGVESMVRYLDTDIKRIVLGLLGVH